MKTETKLIHFSEGIELESGEKLNSFDLMVETYGELNEGKSNAILLCHAFSGNHHAAGSSEDFGIGWWDQLVGCLLYTSPSPRDGTSSRMPSSA